MTDVIANYVRFLAAYRYTPDAPPDYDLLGRSREATAMHAAIRGREAEAMPLLAAQLERVPDAFAASILAIQLGAMIEDGVEPGPLGQACLTRLPGVFARARKYFENGQPVTSDTDGASAWASLQFFTMAAMATWCRDTKSRRAAALNTALVADAQFLGREGTYCHYVGRLLSAADGIELVVLVPEQQRGFVLELHNIFNAAHLFALLESSLVVDAGLVGPRANDAVAAVARGDAPVTRGLQFAIQWHYETWLGVDGRAAARTNGLHHLVAAMIAVDVDLRNLPRFENQAVMLMRAGVLGSRTCLAGEFFAPLHDALRSSIEIRQTLTANEVSAWLERLERGAASLA